MASPQYLVLHPHLSSLPSMIHYDPRTQVFQVAKHRIFTRIPCAFRLFFRIVEKSTVETLHACSLFHPPLSLSFIFSFFIFPSSFQRIVRAREYFTAGINQRNSGKQLIILLLTISRSFLSLLSLSLRSAAKSEAVRPRFYLFFFFWSTRWDFASDCLLECARDEINVISFP